MQNAAVKIEPQASSPVIAFTSDNYARGVAIPWRAKMWTKIILSHLPLTYKLLSNLGMFRHGDVGRNLKNLYNCFTPYFDAYVAKRGSAPEFCLELGPGDSIGHALCAKAEGVRGMVLIDAGDFASNDESHYKAFADYLVSKGKNPGMPAKFDRQSILDFTNSKYYVDGLQSMSLIEDGIIDLSFSQAVFEHISRDDFQPYMHELFRTHKPGGISRHAVDLHDHLGGALNSMRFSHDFWESGAVRRAGFYTNRLTMAEMIACAENAGFNVTIEKIIKWPNLPTPKESMNASFSAKTDDELNVCTFFMTMEKPV